MPLGQGWQEEDPGSDALYPAGQLMHALPDGEAYFPAGHCVQVAELGASVMWPAGHLVQLRFDPVVQGWLA